MTQDIRIADSSAIIILIIINALVMIIFNWKLICPKFKTIKLGY